MYLEPRKGHVITSCCQEHSAFFCQHRFTTCRLNCQFFCWPLTACQSLYHVLLPPICSSPLSHLSSVHPFKCRACLQIPCTGPHGGFCLHSQQSDIYPPNSLNHLKMDPEHPKADTWGSDGLGASQGSHLMSYSHSLSCCSTGKADKQTSSTTNHQHRNLNLATLKQSFDPHLHPG